MECIDCQYQFRYVDKKYAVTVYDKNKVVIVYRCSPCYQSYKDVLYHRFRTGEDRVSY